MLALLKNQSRGLNKWKSPAACDLFDRSRGLVASPFGAEVQTPKVGVVAWRTVFSRVDQTYRILGPRWLLKQAARSAGIILLNNGYLKSVEAPHMGDYSFRLLVGFPVSSCEMDGLRCGGEVYSPGAWLAPGSPARKCLGGIVAGNRWWGLSGRDVVSGVCPRMGREKKFAPGSFPDFCLACCLSAIVVGLKRPRKHQVARQPRHHACWQFYFLPKVNRAAAQTQPCLDLLTPTISVSFFQISRWERVTWDHRASFGPSRRGLDGGAGGAVGLQGGRIHLECCVIQTRRSFPAHCFILLRGFWRTSPTR